MTEEEKRYLEKLFEAYCMFVDGFAEVMQRKYVLPYLEKHHLKFMSGNGDYWMVRQDGTEVDPDTLPKEIQEVLDLQVPGLKAHFLGDLMPEHRAE